MHTNSDHPYGNLIAPNLHFAPYDVVQGIRRFHLVAEEVHQELVTGTTVRAYGYNGSTPGPVIVVHEGERVQIVLYNRLSEPTSIHWHGLIVPDNMDGVPGIGAGPHVTPGQYFIYDFIIQQSGTFMYHAHANDATQEMMGLAGILVSLPRKPLAADRDYVILLQEWSVKEQPGMSNMGSMLGGTMTESSIQGGATTSGGTMPMSMNRESKSSLQEIDPMGMDFNYFTINGKSFPSTETLWVRYGERIRIRIGNLSMDSHPMHLHGHFFEVVASDGFPLSAPFYKNTINVAPGETYDIEFVANNPGAWAFHCHKPHHMTNQHKPSMGGMFSIVQYV